MLVDHIRSFQRSTAAEVPADISDVQKQRIQKLLESAVRYDANKREIKLHMESSVVRDFGVNINVDTAAIVKYLEDNGFSTTTDSTVVTVRWD